jgi:hypothetical protein
VGGALLGVGASYLGGLVQALQPPQELADRLTRSRPVEWAVVRERSLQLQGSLWVFPYAVSDRPEIVRLLSEGAHSEFELSEALYAVGAADVNVTLFKLSLTGRRNSPVRVTGMRARLTGRQPPLRDGTVLTPGPQGAEANLPLGFDLDSEDLEARVVVGPITLRGDIYGDRWFEGQTVALAEQEQVVFGVLARTLTSSVEWLIDVDVLLGDGARETVTVGFGDEPFRTTALVTDPGLDDVTAPDQDAYAEVWLDTRFTPEVLPSDAGSTRFVRTK